ncbi:MAG: class I SAM-dependent RNA methyltransferase [Sphingomonadaceae bacterium]
MMNVHNGSETILRLAARGDGVTADGRFVPGAVPGDTVSAEGVIVPGPGHVQPACRHFGVCGGCQLQHVAEPLLADFARDRILEPLARAGITPKRIMPVHVSPPGSRRRAAMRATKRNGRIMLGFNAAGTHDLVDIEECPVLRPRLFALVEPLRALLSRHIGERSAIAVTMTDTDQGVDLSLSNLQARQLPVIEGLTEFAANYGLARLSLAGPDGPETIVATSPPTIRMGGVAVQVPPGAFLQATADGEAALVGAVQDIVGASRHIADLFAGAGTFALPLAASARILAADAAGPALKALEQAARASGRPVQIDHRDLFRRPYVVDELDRFDAVVIDPPRAGAIAQSAELAQSRVPAIAAVSCNPATFARDAERFVAGGYTLDRLWPVAQFRWSTHVELAAEFRR